MFLLSYSQCLICTHGAYVYFIRLATIPSCFTEVGRVATKSFGILNLQFLLLIRLSIFVLNLQWRILSVRFLESLVHGAVNQVIASTIRQQQCED
jgi:hypothetical protein